MSHQKTTLLRENHPGRQYRGKEWTGEGQVEDGSRTSASGWKKMLLDEGKEWDTGEHILGSFMHLLSHRTETKGVATSHVLTHLHVCGEGIRVLSLDLLNGAVALLLIATCEDDVIASLTEVPCHLKPEARVRSSYDDNSSCHCCRLSLLRTQW